MNGSQRIFDILIRYSVLVILSIGGLWIFYIVFTPLTVYPVFFLLNYFFGAVLNSEASVVLVAGIPIELIEACIAGSAYYLLIIFNLSTPEIKINQRLRMIFFSFLIFLAANILRIFVLSVLYMTASPVFDITHRFSWYFGSVVLILAIWFCQVKTYRIREIPFYSDLRFLYGHSLLKANPKANSRRN